jgi:hypothetical protein
MRRVCARELVSVDGTMEPPEEWAFSCSNDEIEEANASGGFSNRIALLPSGMRSRARDGRSDGSIDGRRDHDRRADDRPHHPVGGRPAG